MPSSHNSTRENWQVDFHNIAIIQSSHNGIDVSFTFGEVVEKSKQLSEILSEIQVFLIILELFNI
jgi:hypothetical protein